MRCKYWDCGWCYAPDSKDHNAVRGECREPTRCREYASQDVSKIEIIEDNEAVLRQTIRDQQDTINQLRNALRRVKEISKKYG